MFKFGSQVLASHVNGQTHKLNTERTQMFLKVKSSGDKNEHPIITEEWSTSSCATSSQVQSANMTKATVKPSFELLLEDGQKR